MEIIASFPKCPKCGSEETVAKKGFTEMVAKGRIAKDAFLCIRTDQPLVPPIQQSKVMALLTVDCIQLHWDLCLQCGQERCTRADLVTLPLQLQMQPPPNGMGGPRPPHM